MPTNIRWNGAEAAKVAVLAANIEHREGIGFLDAVRQAQKALPPFRQRMLRQVQAIEPLREAFERELAGLRAGTSSPVLAPSEFVAALPSSKIEVALRALVEALSEQVSEDVYRRVMERVRDEFQPTPLEAAPPPPPKEKRRLPRVLVVGLKPNQQQTVRSALDEIADLRMFDNTATVQQIRATAAYCERAYVMVDFVAHSKSDAVLEAVHGAALVRGTVSSLLAKLRDDLIGAQIIAASSGSSTVS